MLTKNTLAVAVITAALTVSGGAMAASDPTGVWLDESGRGAVEIKQCGSKLCGHVVWVRDQADAAKGCGRQIIGDIKSAGDGTWGNGWIYSPERDSKYDVEVEPLPNGNLKVLGYAGTKLFSKTMTWKPAPADLERCGEQVAAKAPTTEEKAEVDTKKDVKKAETKKSKKVEEDDEQEVASNDKDDDSKDSGADLAGKLGEFIKADKNGNCKLDTPWVKIDFKCQK